MNYTKEDIVEKLKVFDDDKFKFEPEEHVYTYDGKVMRGTTTFLNRFVIPFESDYYSKKKAEERGITQEEILEEWDSIRDRACDLGNMVHDYIENFYINESTELTDDEEANARILEWHKIYDNRLHHLESVATEIKMFSTKYNIAGTADKLYLYDGQLIIGDWKTNKKIKTDKDFCFRKFLKWPFDNLKENEINKYSMQLSMYAIMLEDIGLKVSSMFICHIPPEGECKVYKIKDLRVPLRSYLDNSMLLTEEIDVSDDEEVEKIKKTIRHDVIW